MWIKICGNTSFEDALSAAESGADALGFVFAESPRQVTVQQVRDITPYLPDEVQTYGVFVNPEFEAVVSAVLECGLSGVQLHTLQDPTLPGRLRTYFDESLGGGQLQILGALPYSPDLSETLDRISVEGELDAVLVDSHTARAVGGTGVPYDWKAAREIFLRHSANLNLVVAGGLTPDNVTAAISMLNPRGVDVVSGVESGAGKKDPALVRAFIKNARVAAAKIASGQPIRS